MTQKIMVGMLIRESLKYSFNESLDGSIPFDEQCCLQKDGASSTVIAKPNTLKTYKKFEAEIYVLSKDEGGRHTAFFSSYYPQFYLRTADICRKVEKEITESVKVIILVDNVTAAFELILPVPLEQVGKRKLDAAVYNEYTLRAKSRGNCVNAIRFACRLKDHQKRWNDAYDACMYYYHTNEFDLYRKEQEAFEKACPLK